MKNYGKKIMAAVLIFALTMTVLLPETSASAAYWQTVYSSRGTVTVAGGQTFETKISLKSYSDIMWRTTLKSLFGYTLTLSDLTGKQLESKHIADSDTSWVPEGQVSEMVYIHADSFKGYKEGTYTISVKFDGDSEVQASFLAKTMAVSETVPTLEDQEVTAGFQKTLTVANDTIKTCVSSNTKVASVTAQGVVTGKKKGTAKVTVTTEKGVSLTCNVIVKANIYSTEKAKKKEVSTSYSVKPYYAKYDAKGNLVVKAMVFNKTPRKVKMRIWPDSFKNMSRMKKMAFVTLKANRSKSVTLKFSKSSLRKQKVNLPADGLKLLFSGEMK